MLCSTSPHLALLALLSVAGAVGPGEPCPSEMNLIKDQLQVNCSGKGLSVVPLALPTNTSILLLSSNRLASVSTAAFQHLPELAELDLSGNALGALHTGPPLPLLQELVLSHNALRVLPTLQGLPALTRLVLAHNNISGLLPGAFRDVGQLTELNLRGNQLRTLPEEAFEGLAMLKDLDLSDNALEELPRGLLTGLKLDKLWLSGNQLRTLPSSFFPEGHIFAYVYLAGNPWRCDCGLAYLRGWIEDNDFSIYIQEQGSDGLLTENDPQSPVCDEPHRHHGSPVLEFQQACGKAGDTDLDIDGTMTEEGTPVPSATVRPTTLPPTNPVPPTIASSTTLPATTPPPTTPVPPTIAPSTTQPPTTPMPPTIAPSTTQLPTTPVPSTTAPSTTLPPTTTMPPTTAPELAPPRLPSTPMTPTTSLIPSPPFHTSPLHITPCHQPPPPMGAPRLCTCPTLPPAMPIGHRQGREGPQWGHWVLAHCCLLHLALYLASLLLLLLPMLALLGWMGWVYLGWYRPALRSPPGARLVRYQLLRKGEGTAPPMMHLSSFRSPIEPPTFRTTKELRIHRDPPVPSFRRVTRRLLSVGGLGPWRAPSAYSLDRGEAAIGAVRVKYATTTL
ncbi:platelet glycoprotein Ib alpha chain-like [Malaclemys terrapin pileata]|uniref:platelet glycoprotein Ib alpha chain-like n=1 Tax=Malaclemys terrapin pileata TaxID=2991368 RepID=UPI0023A88C47|nr:platelet glycoprotein Ib alpha chain-like [Malaclemys terrapin pileata]